MAKEDIFKFEKEERDNFKNRASKAKSKISRKRFSKAEDDPVLYLEALLEEAHIEPHSTAALQFLKNKSRQAFGTTNFPLEVLESASQEIVGRNKIVPNWVNTGKLYSFRYWPENFDTIEYFDMNPLIFIVDFESKYSWRGINLHYLDPNIRNKLYYDLRQWLTNKNYDQHTRVRMYYQYLKRFKKYI